MEDLSFLRNNKNTINNQIILIKVITPTKKATSNNSNGIFDKIKPDIIKTNVVTSIERDKQTTKNKNG